MLKATKVLSLNCDRLWKIWYSVLIILLQILVISLAISNYMTYKEQSFNPRFGNAWLSMPMNIQLGSIIVSLSTMVFFIYACIFKVGNVANDGVELGIDSLSIKNALNEISLNSGISLFMTRLCTHLLPYSCMIHVIIGLIISLPVPLLQAEQIKNEAISREWIWRTDIDFFLKPTSNEKGQYPLSTLCFHGKPCEYPTTPAVILPEFINLAIALLILTIKIPTPFWFTNKAFSIIFSLFSFVTTLCILFEYQAIVSFIKIFHNYDKINQNFNKWISEWLIISLFFLKSLFMMFMLVIVFEYGYTQFLINMRKYRQYMSFEISDSVSQQSLNNQQIKWYQIAPRFFGCFVLVIIMIVSFPIIFAIIKLNGYIEQTNKPISSALIPGVILNAVYFIASIFLWFGLCVKSKWQFHINFQSFQPLVGLERMKMIRESPEPVYGCFYNPPSLSSHTSIYKQPINRSSIDESESGSNRNYVYMHPPVGQITENCEYDTNIPIGSEISFGSKSCDSRDMNPYKSRLYGNNYFSQRQSDIISEDAPYATLASLKSKGLILYNKSPVGMIQSDTSSNENYSRQQTQRRGSNRVTFKVEESSCRPPDILARSDNDSNALIPFNTQKNFDTDLEMSTDMRQLDEKSPENKINEETSSNDIQIDSQDPKMCSQV